MIRNLTHVTLVVEREKNVPSSSQLPERNPVIRISKIALLQRRIVSIPVTIGMSRILDSSLETCFIGGSERKSPSARGDQARTSDYKFKSDLNYLLTWNTNYLIIKNTWGFVDGNFKTIKRNSSKTIQWVLWFGAFCVLYKLIIVFLGNVSQQLYIEFTQISIPVRCLYLQRG